MRPAKTYAGVTHGVEAAIAGMSQKDAERALYMIARAALLRLSVTRGASGGAATAYALADEMACSR